MVEVKKVIVWFNVKGGMIFEINEGFVGGFVYDVYGQLIFEEDMVKVMGVDVVIFGVVGGLKWDDVFYEVCLEVGFLCLCKDMELFVNLCLVICYLVFVDVFFLKKDIIEGFDILIVWELMGGVYFGELKEIIDFGNGQKCGVDMQVYDIYEIEWILKVVFEFVCIWNNKVMFMEKWNVMKFGVLWNEVVIQIYKNGYEDVELEYMLVDVGGMQLVCWLKQFDVIVIDNLFGDMLLDVVVMLIGFLGMLLLVLFGVLDVKMGKCKVFYELVYGLVLDIVGMGVVNLIVMIVFFGMVLCYFFEEVVVVDKLD